MNTAMNTIATKPSANAIGMPENITTSVTPPNRRPIARMLIVARRFGAPRTIMRRPKKWPSALQQRAGATSSVIPSAIRP